MCFSATASFASAAALATTGAVTLALDKDPKRRWFVALPFIFGAQQAAEGFVWMSMGNSFLLEWQRYAVIAFMTFAFVIWPALIPWAVQRMEPDPKRRRWFYVLGAAGLFFAVVATYVIITGNPRSQIIGQCLDYSFEKNTASFFPPNMHAIFYFSATVLPFFVSSLRWVKITGALIFSGLLIALASWKYAVTSVWCFFAAIASFYICAHVYRENHELQKMKSKEIKCG